MNSCSLATAFLLLWSVQSLAQSIETESPSCDPAEVADIQDSAKNGSPRAEYLLARYYSTGKCLPGDGAKAIELYEKAAQVHYPRAFYNLGIIHAGKNDYKGAEALFSQGADLGHRGSELQLGILYSLAPAPVGDHVKAVAWLTLTANRSESIAEEAKDVLRRIKQRMEPDVWAPASKMAEELKVKYGLIPEFKD